MNKNSNINQITDLSVMAFENGYDPDAINDLLDAIYSYHSKEIRQKCINEILAVAKKYRKLTDFKKQLNVYNKQYIQKQKQKIVSGSSTLSTAPEGYEYIKDNYLCGDYILDDNGVFKTFFSKDGDFEILPICSHPLVILERLCNMQSNLEKITLAFKTKDTWKTVTIEREIISSNLKIIKLSNYGIDVTSENAKDIVKYLQRLIQCNSSQIKICNTTNRLGWHDNEFVPYSNRIKCDMQTEFAPICNSIKNKGEYDIWRNHSENLRKNIYLRLVMAASFASPLIAKIGGLPFIVHLWGGTGTGKTVALNVAASIWGRPDGGLVRTLNGTDYGLNETAAFLYSLPCILDELQTIKGGSAFYNQMIMRLTEGISRTQGAATGGIKQTKQWRNCFICSGEENIVKDNSGGGSINRVISLETQGSVITDGNYTMNIVRNNYGFAGRIFIKGLLNENNLQDRYRSILQQLQLQTKGTDKQCMAMAFLLLADELSTKYIFQNENPLKVQDVERFMATKSEVDVAERCYKWLLSWVAQNKNRFEDTENNKGEIWGKICEKFIMINKNVLSDHMNQAGFDYGEIITKFADREYIERNSTGKFVHQTKVFSLKASYIKLLLPDDEYSDVTDDNSPF